MLIDYKAHADRKGIRYSPFDPHKITIAVVEEIARDQGVVFRQGDLFLLRTGYTEAMQDASEAEQKVMTSSHDSVGIENTLDAVRFFWNHHFSAVAADCIGFEVMRPTKDGVDASGTTVDYGELVARPVALSSGFYFLWHYYVVCHQNCRETFSLPRFVCVKGILLLISTDIRESSSSPPPGTSRLAHWRALGPESVIRILSEDWAIHFHVDVGSIEFCWRRGLAAECSRDLLRGSFQARYEGKCG